MRAYVKEMQAARRIIRKGIFTGNAMKKAMKHLGRARATVQVMEALNGDLNAFRAVNEYKKEAARLKGYDMRDLDGIYQANSLEVGELVKLVTKPGVELPDDFSTRLAKAGITNRFLQTSVQEAAAFRALQKTGNRHKRETAITPGRSTISAGSAWIFLKVISAMTARVLAGCGNCSVKRTLDSRS
jgi:hypothetical protein